MNYWLRQCIRLSWGKLRHVKDRRATTVTQPTFPKGVDRLPVADVEQRIAPTSPNPESPSPGDEKKTRFLVVLANYGSDQLDYLCRVVSEFRSFDSARFHVDVVIHSDEPYAIEPLASCEFAICRPHNPHLLPSSCRRTILERCQDYDLFLYSENDQLYRQDQVDAFLECSGVLPDDRIAGFIQYEQSGDKRGRVFPAYFGAFRWKPRSVEVYGGKVFARFTNLHHAGFLLTKKHLQRVIEHTDFLEIRPPYNLKCSVGTNPYEYGGMAKVICISEFERFLTHHLPDKYAKNMNPVFDVQDDRQMQRDIRRLMRSAKVPVAN